MNNKIEYEPIKPILKKPLEIEAELLASEKGNLPTPLEELHKRLMDNYALSRKPNRYEDAIDMLNEGNL